MVAGAAARKTNRSYFTSRRPFAVVAGQSFILQVIIACRRGPQPPPWCRLLMPIRHERSSTRCIVFRLPRAVQRCHPVGAAASRRRRPHGAHQPAARCPFRNRRPAAASSADRSFQLLAAPADTPSGTAGADYPAGPRTTFFRLPAIAAERTC